MKKIEHLVLIDGSGYIFRAYYALPSMTKSDGTPVNAVFGFCNMLLKQLEEIQMEKGGNVAVAVIFDAARKTFRNEIYDQYKANRSDPPEDLVPQFEIIKRIPNMFNLPSIESLGFEADDIIASYAKQATKKNIKVTIISSDKDLMQLITENVSMLDPLKNKEINKDDVFEKFGVFPEKVIDVQSLAGDSSDNIPGIPGIGVKTAALLINEYGGLEELLEKCESIKQNKRRETVKSNKDIALISKKLVTLKDDLDLPTPINELAFKPLNIENLIDFLDEMEFKRIKTQVLNKFGSKKTINGEINPNKKTEVIETKTSKIDKSKYRLILSEEELKEWIKKIYIKGYVAIDCETNELSPTFANIVGFSLSLEESDSCYIPINHKIAKPEKQISEQKFVELISPVMSDDSILKIGQNIKYDIIILNKIGIDVNNIDDTMLMSYVLNAGRHKHGLDDLALLYLGHKTILFKEIVGKGREKKSFEQISFEDAKNYAAEDADITFRLWQIFRKSLINQKLFSFYSYIEKPLINVIKDMEVSGIKVDFDFLNKLSQKFERKLFEIEKNIFKLSGEKFNIGSPKQLGEVLFDKMKLPFGKKGKSGNYQTDVGILEKLKIEKIKIADYLLSWRMLKKLQTTYCEGLISRKSISGRVHTSYGMASTLTGRLSSNDPNLQNIPIKNAEGKEIRDAFVCDEKMQIVSIDYSQIELRILAHVANIDSLKFGFKNGDDVHSLTAQDVFQVEASDVTEELRRRAKTINFGIIYGISPFGLANQLDISNTEAKNYIDRYFKRYPGIQKYMNETINLCREKKYVETLFGRKIFIPYINDKTANRRNFAERSAINAPIQGGAADMIKRAMIKVHNFIKTNNLKTKMLLQVHDELIFEVPDQEVSEIPTQIANIMENSYKPVINFEVPLIADIGKGKSWSEAH